ncbi:MAG: hypothetical protein ACI8XO_003944 [Verrucomicrobiales bacterium]|jgi:hypothetical protein
MRSASGGMQSSLEGSAAPDSTADLTPGGAHWGTPDVDDVAWYSGTTGVGYERSSSGTSYTSLIGAESNSAIYNRRTSALIRIPFEVVQAYRYSSLKLRMKYDDGYVAYLNGVGIARRNAPAGAPLWNSSANGSHDDRAAIVFADVDVSANLAGLRSGTNILDIHGLNTDLTSSDFLILPELVADVSGAHIVYIEWAAAEGLSGADALPEFDFDRDGKSNLFEYAFASSPTTPDPNEAMAMISADGQHVELSYRRRADFVERGIRYQTQLSLDLGGWVEADASVIDSSPAPGGAEIVRVSIPMPAGGASIAYVRMIAWLDAS